ncbi:MAG: XamI family restriction endonuclease [Ktedonobacteraceae bacterium]
MPVNASKPERWKADIVQSVDLYNNWFLQFAPDTYRKTRIETTKQVENAIRFVLFLCGYFDSGYLGYEAAEGIDWVWEHRINDLAEFGV